MVYFFISVLLGFLIYDTPITSVCIRQAKITVANYNFTLGIAATARSGPLSDLAALSWTLHQYILGLLLLAQSADNPEPWAHRRTESAWFK